MTQSNRSSLAGSSVGFREWQRTNSQSMSEWGRRASAEEDSNVLLSHTKSLAMRKVTSMARPHGPRPVLHKSGTGADLMEEEYMDLMQQNQRMDQECRDLWMQVKELSGSCSLFEHELRDSQHKLEEMEEAKEDMSGVNVHELAHEADVLRECEQEAHSELFAECNKAETTREELQARAEKAHHMEQEAKDLAEKLGDKMKNLQLEMEEAQHHRQQEIQEALVFREELRESKEALAIEKDRQDRRGSRRKSDDMPPAFQFAGTGDSLFDQLNVARSPDLVEEMEELEEEFKESELQSQRHLEEKEQEVSQLNRHCYHFESELAESQHQYQGLKATHEEELLALQKLMMEANELRENEQESGTENRALRAQVEKTREELHEISEKAQQTELEAEELGQRLKEMERLADEFKESGLQSQRQLEEKEQEAAMLNQHCHQFESQLEESHHQWQGLKAMHEEELIALERSMTEANELRRDEQEVHAENRALHKHVEKTSEELLETSGKAQQSKFQADSLAQRLEEMEGLAEELKETGLQKQRHLQEKEQEVSQLSMHCRQFESENEELQQQWQGLKAAHEEKLLAHEKLMAEANELREREQEARGISRALSRQVEKTNEELQATSDKVQRTELQAETLAARLEEMQGLTEELRKSEEHKQRHLEKKELEVLQLSTHCRQLDSELQDSQRQWQGLKAAHEEELIVLEKLRAKADELRRNEQEAYTENKALHRQVEKTSEELRETSDKVQRKAQQTEVLAELLNRSERRSEQLIKEEQEAQVCQKLRDEAMGAELCSLKMERLQDELFPHNRAVLSTLAGVEESRAQANSQEQQLSPMQMDVNELELQRFRDDMKAAEAVRMQDVLRQRLFFRVLSQGFGNTVKRTSSSNVVLPPPETTEWGPRQLVRDGSRPFGLPRR